MDILHFYNINYIFYVSTPRIISRDDSIIPYSTRT